MTKIDFASYAPQKVFLLQGNEAAFDAVVAALMANDPLIQALSVPRFTIEHARNIAEFAIEGTGAARMFVIYFSVFSPEAAQVLLKPLEEPAPETTIIFITRYPYLVPQTVRSRLTLISEKKENENDERTIKKIIAEMQKEAAEKDDDAATRRSRAVALLDDLESVAKGNNRYIESIYRAKSMLFKANMPTKYVLDYLSTIIR